MTFDVVRNAPLPLMDVDFVDVARELLDVILDYAQHLASFKMGGAEFAATQGHYERLIRLASQQNERLKANAGNFDILAEKSQKEDKQRPRMEL